MRFSHATLAILRVRLVGLSSVMLVPPRPIHCLWFLFLDVRLAIRLLDFREILILCAVMVVDRIMTVTHSS